MVNCWLVVALLSLPGVVTTLTTADTNSYDAQAQAIVDGFSAAEILGQMTQLDLSTVMNNVTRELNETAVRMFAKKSVGSYFNTYYEEKPFKGYYGYNATGFRTLVNRIQEISMEENGGHHVIYGLDSIHGANYLSGSVKLPHQINSAASFNLDLVHKVGQITARDTEAAGISWIFGPILDISQNTLWARTFETFGEDPKIEYKALILHQHLTTVPINFQNLIYRKKEMTIAFRLVDSDYPDI